MKLSLLAATQHPAFRDSESDETTASEQGNMQEFVEAKRSDLRNGLTRRQRTFILAQGDDFRTFLGDFVAALPQIEFPGGVST
jgi:hypothetical protein